MQTMRLGRTGLRVTRLGFGGIPIQRASDEEAVAVVKRCLDLGINFLDTANAYTTSEGRIGRAIKGQRERLILATKSLSRTPDGIKAHLKLSLERLGVEYIDLYQFHSVSDFDSYKKVLAPGGPLAVVREAQRSGLVRHIGITAHSMDVAREAVKSDQFETIMFPFNFITSEPATELLPLAREHDVGFIAMKPLAGGVLENVTIAFKYLAQFPDVLMLAGIERVHEIDQIVQILNGPLELTETGRAEIDRLREELGTAFCRRCDYCQPCTAGIPISLVMGAKSLLKRLPPERLLTGYIAEGLEKAAECTRCGECEKRCPFNLPIMKMMEESSDLYQEAKSRGFR